MKVKEENEKIGLKLKIQKTKIMASVLITSWQIDGMVGYSKLQRQGHCPDGAFQPNWINAAWTRLQPKADCKKCPRKVHIQGHY